MGIRSAPAVQEVLEGAADGVSRTWHYPAQGSDQIRKTLDLVLVPSHLDHLRTGERSSDRDRLQQLRHLNRVHPEPLLPLRRKEGNWSTGNWQEGTQGRRRKWRVFELREGIKSLEV